MVRDRETETKTKEKQRDSKDVYGAARKKKLRD